jgi:hypothetical protein
LPYALGSAALLACACLQSRSAFGENPRQCGKACRGTKRFSGNSHDLDFNSSQKRPRGMPRVFQGGPGSPFAPPHGAVPPIPKETPRMLKCSGKRAGLSSRPADQERHRDQHGRQRCMARQVFVERLWRSVKYEEVYLRVYDSVAEARTSIGRYLDFYNRRRPHSNLDRRTPDQLTSPRCPSAWQPNHGRRATYQRGKTVQTTETAIGLKCPLMSCLAAISRFTVHRYEFVVVAKESSFR